MPNATLNRDELGRLSGERALSAPTLAGTPPSVPLNLVATARNLGISIQWSSVAGVDGYNVIINSTQDFSKPDVQIVVSGGASRDYFYNVGNVALTRYITVQSVKGSRVSAYATPVKVSTGVATSSSNVAGDTAYAAETTLATVTLTTTGNTLFICGAATLSQNGGDKDTWFRLKQDGATLITNKALAKNTSSGFGYQAVIFSFSTPAAGAHTYIITAENNSDGNTCNASTISLIVMEVPLLTSSASPTVAPSTPPVVNQPYNYPTGPGSRGGYGGL